MDHRTAGVAAAALAIAGLLLLAISRPDEREDTATIDDTAPATGLDLPAISSAEWTALPLRPGDWNWRGDPGSGDTHAEFAGTDGENLVHLRCEPGNGDLVLSLANGDIQARAIIVHTETQSRQLAADAGEGSISTRIARDDDLLDAMAFSRGRIAFEVEGGLAFSVPAYPEITRVVEDCR